MADPENLDDLRRIARDRAAAQRRVAELIAAETDAMRTAVDTTTTPRGIYARLRDATGWSDEYCRQAVEKSRRHAATPSPDSPTP